MIIELFGPPGSGKTTLARAIVSRLQAGGRAGEVMLSSRPAEHALASTEGTIYAAPVERLTRAIIETLAAARPVSSDPQSQSIAGTLVRTLPPKNLIWSFRLRQYAARLVRRWETAAAQDGVSVFDQGFVQLICSLVLVGSPPSEEQIALALDLVPVPDILVRIDVPRRVLKVRLMERARHQGRLERLLELDLETSLGSIEVAGRVHDTLRRHGRRVACVECGDRNALRNAVDWLEKEVSERGPLARSACRSGAA